MPLAGRKPWGLLAYLCLEHETTRHDLAALLFSAADDPWPPCAGRCSGPPGPDRPGRGGRAPRPPVDVARVLSGDVSADEAGRLRSGELLAGLAFDDEPGFDNWLLLQRSRVGAAVAETHAWAASALAHTDPEAALDLIGLATRADPFNDSLHELAVELHMTRGTGPRPRPGSAR